MNRPLSHLVILLLAALTAALLAVPAAASASRPNHPQTAAPTATSSTNRTSGRSAISRGRALRRHNQRLVKIRKRDARRRAIAVKNGVAVASQAVDNPEILFRGDFEAGFDGWHVQSLAERATLFSSGAFQGGQAARFEVRDGDIEPETGSQRSEVSGPTFSEGQDLYIRDAIRIPSGNTYEGPWQIIQQLHEEDWNDSPGVAVFLDSKRTLRLGPGDGSRTFWNSVPLQSNRWYDLIYRVNLSQSSSVGFVEVWLDGVQQSLAGGQTRIYGQTMQMPETYLKAGIYRSRSSTGTSIVEHDAITVGTSYAAVTTG